MDVFKCFQEGKVKGDVGLIFKIPGSGLGKVETRADIGRGILAEFHLPSIRFN